MVSSLYIYIVYKKLSNLAIPSPWLSLAGQTLTRDSGPHARLLLAYLTILCPTDISYSVSPVQAVVGCASVYRRCSDCARDNHLI